MGAYQGRYVRSRKKKYTWLLTGVYALVFAMITYLLGLEYASGGQLQMPLGWGSAIVLSNSMKPTFEKDDLLLVREKAKHPQIGDIVIYKNEESLVVHRVVAYEDGIVTTKGDANSGEDPEFPEEKIQAYVVFVIPQVGKLIRFIQTPWGISLIIILLLALRGLLAFIDWRAMEKTRTEIKYDIQYMREETGRILQQMEVRKK